MIYKLIIITIAILTINYTNIIQIFAKAPVAKKSTDYPSKLLFDTLLHPGLKYSNILFGKRVNKISANILEFDLTNPELELAVLKAKNNISELDKLHGIVNIADSSDGKLTLAAINGSFWKAYRNNPIGACIIEGVVVEMNPYKEWTGIFFDSLSRPTIDNFKLSGKVKLHDGKIINLTSVNRRRDSAGIVLYNKYGGYVIPHVNDATIEKMISEAYLTLLSDSTFMADDSTEVEFDFEEFERNIMTSARNEKLEGSILKALIEYIDKPAINRTVRGVVNYVDTGFVSINDNQTVLSLGYNLPPDILVYAGDTLEILFETDLYRETEFFHAVTATPRLVRGGNAAHEAYREGSKSRRFINGQLGRTAIGYNKDRTKLYLVTIDHSNRSAKKKGSSLGELAQIMKQIGCYDAMNLDGGGSSVMVIDGKNIMAKSNPNASRKISVGIGIRKKR
ncbi:MAG: phosphodiester glycosidase family protein [Candidatus Kapabacteria bacterium]|nr:phosphodiester glycosidase family protein [Ignavibacteriota bacterium]MCW5886168.1 phosphodiester glycosidase family protein [Candidatus Kapabacteria bacterium]